jgi:DNA-binding NarL/FixJ family response regulator
MIADQHPAVRKGLRTLLNSQPELQLVGEVADHQTTAAKVTALRPDVLLLNLFMLQQGDLGVIEQIKATYPQTRVLLIDGLLADSQVAPALAAGAHGCVCMDTSPHDLLQAIHTVHQGQRWVDPSLAAYTPNGRTHSIFQREKNYAAD